VRQAFEGFARIYQMDYPGEVARWRAERVTPRPGRAGWGLVQDGRFGAGRFRFGLAVSGQARPLIVVARFADGAQPYAARLVLRDRTRTSGPYLDGRLAGPSGRLPLPARFPPRFATEAFTAEARSPAGRDLRGDMPWALAFRFPPAAARAMTALDPREAVAVEFLFSGPSGHDVVRTAFIEVGDFAAGAAFLAAG
jgi:hypothetical protein